MNSFNQPNRYSSLSITLHWLMLLVIAAAFATIELRTSYPRGSDIREGLKTWHFMLGLSVFALVIVRIAARLLTATPADLPEPTWRKALAKLTHLALYALMIGMPILISLRSVNPWWVGLAWSGVAAVGCGVIPYAVILHGVRRGALGARRRRRQPV